MDPIPSQSVNLASAVQALLVKQGATLEGTTLMALLGQEVDVLFQALTPGGVKLQLPSGQVLTAQGELPYPEGTQLRVRIMPAATGETGLRLQLQEARPPAPPAFLAPLTQSEATVLAARLTQETPSPGLEPLLRLLSVLADVQPEPGILPSAERLQQALQALPESLSASLGRVLGTGASSQELAAALQTFMRDPQKALPGEALLRSAPDADQSLKLLVQQVVMRFQTLVSRSAEIPEGDKDTLILWIRNLLQKTEEEAPPAPRSAAPLPGPRTDPGLRSDPGVRSSPATGSEALIPPKLATLLQAQSGSKAELPEAWESWIRGTVSTLTDPAISPREAGFHALQAKEGTAFLEIPLPWAQASPLQLWVESDPSEERQGGGDPTKRVLLGLRFSNLGETRLGMAQGSFGLQIRVWTEHPEALEREQERMKQELKDLGKPVDLRIYALTYGPDGTIPSLRSVVVGPSLRALG